jgi:hypothetical protein
MMNQEGITPTWHALMAAAERRHQRFDHQYCSGLIMLASLISFTVYDFILAIFTHGGAKIDNTLIHLENFFHVHLPSSLQLYVLQ